MIRTHLVDQEPYEYSDYQKLDIIKISVLDQNGNQSFAKCNIFSD